MSQPLVIFDLDGTLAHTGPDLLATLNRTTAEYGIEPMTMDTLNYVLGQGALAMLAKAFERQGKTLSAELQQTLYGRFLADYEHNICNETRLFEGVTEAMETLHDEGFIFAVCTNKTEKMAKILLEKLGIHNRFKAVTGGDTFSFRKPDARHLEETARLSGSPLENAIMVGDSKADIGAANNAGIPSVAVTFGYTDIPPHELGASAVIDHFTKLPDAVIKLTKNTN